MLFHLLFFYLLSFFILYIVIKKFVKFNLKVATFIKIVSMVVASIRTMTDGNMNTEILC